MPPHGLYPVPRHHLYRSSGPRPTFSAKDFANLPEPGPTPTDVADRECEREKATSSEAQRDHLHSNCGFRLSSSARDLEHSSSNTTSPARACNSNNSMEGTASDKKNKKKARKSSAGDSIMSSLNTKVKRSTLEAANEIFASAKKAHKKRKHRRESISSVADARPTSKVAKIAAQYDQLLTAAGRSGASQPSLSKETVESHKKEKKKKNRESNKRHSDFTKALANDASLDNRTLKAHPASPQELETVKAEARNADDKPEAKAAPSPVKKSHIPLPGECNPAKAASARKHDAAEPAKEPIIQVHSSPIKKTYIPIPTRSAPNAIRNSKSTNHFNDPETVIPETPPSRAPKAATPISKTPIPLPLSSSMPEPLSSPSRPPKVPTIIRKVTVPHPFRRTNVTGEEADDFSEKKIIGSRYKGYPDLKPQVTKKITQPLTDGPKPKPRSKLERSRSRSSSISSNASLPAMFSQMAKSLDGVNDVKVNDDPLNTSKANTGAQSFDQLFGRLRGALNFSTELEYLAQFKDWHAENTSEYPMPCLHELTACNSRREEAIRHLRVDGKPSKYLRKRLAEDADLTNMHRAADAIKIAENFLEHSLRAQVPVPIGNITGTWSLYAPVYSVHHHDAWADGLRKFTLFRSLKANTYKAQLSLPPRSSVPMPICKFTVQPHASFRTIIVKMEPEGYEMDVVFLGNGYLHLRVDLNLLLKGMPTKSGDRKVWMEFVGVHEGAVEWDGKKNWEAEGVEESDLEIVMDE